MIPRIGFQPGWGMPPGGTIEGHRRGIGDITARDARGFFPSTPVAAATEQIHTEQIQTAQIQNVPLPRNPDRPLDETLVPGWE